MAIDEMLEKHFVTEIGVVLSNTDFSRMVALRDEEAESTPCGIRSYSLVVLGHILQRKVF